MEKIGHEEDILRRFLITIGIIIAIVVFLTNVISKRHAERNAMLVREHTLSAEVNQLERENSRLHRLHNGLLTDPLQIERYAREHLNYISPGEKVYKRLNFEIAPNGKEREASLRLKRPLFEGRFPWQIPTIIILVSTIVIYISCSFENHRRKDHGVIP